MDRDPIFRILKERHSDLKQRGVKSLAVFGSTARGEASAESDLDLLVEFECPVGFFDFLSLKGTLEEYTGCRVDLVTPDFYTFSFRIPRGIKGKPTRTTRTSKSRRVYRYAAI